MPNSPQTAILNGRRLLKLYVGAVLTVFMLLMLSLFNGEKKEANTVLTVDDDEIIAIIEEYQRDKIARVSVSLANIESVVPAPTAPAWITNAASVPAQTIPADTPKIAIIIDDLGLDKNASQQLAAMKGPYTLAYLPYAEELEVQTATVRRAGHELMVHLPMQSHRQSADPGTKALLSGLSFEEFGHRIDWNLTRFEGFVGINNHMGSLLTEDAALMVRLMARLRNDGLLFVDSLTTPNSVGRRAAKALGVPFVARDIFLDNEQDMDYIARQLASTEKIARIRGYAIAIGHPYANTLQSLAEWQDSLEFKGLQLVPISQIMQEAIARQQTQSR